MNPLLYPAHRRSFLRAWALALGCGLLAFVVEGAVGREAALTTIDALIKGEKFLEALPLAENHLANFPDSLPAKKLLAIVHRGLKNFTRAGQLFQECLATNPRDWSHHAQLGTLYAMQKDYPLALRYYRAGLELNPGNSKLQQKIIEMEQAQTAGEGPLVAIKGGVAPLPLSQESLKSRPVMATIESFEAEAQRLIFQKKDLDGALEHLKSMSELGYESEAVIEMLAYTFALRARRHLHSNHLEEGVIDGKRSLRVNPGNPFPYLVLAAIEQKKGNTDNAKTWYLKGADYFDMADLEAIQEVEKRSPTAFEEYDSLISELGAAFSRLATNQEGAEDFKHRARWWGF